MTATPFLKWCGGKRQLLSKILPLVPKKIGTYYEPFLGGGAVFFALANEKRFERAVLSDANKELVTTWRVVQDDVEGLIAAIARFRNTKAEYTRLCAMNPSELPDLQVAARMIYLNRNCFNGLYRVNKAGKFNVPYGGPNDFNPVVLRAASAALAQNVTIFWANACSASFDQAKAGDFAFFDPPYLPLTDAPAFTAFTADGFGHDDQAELASTFTRLAHKGVAVLLSNSDCQLSRFLYRNHRIISVKARRSVNSNGAGRGDVGEILVQGMAP